ncbi:MAG: YdcF family protein [Bradyrhizobiaceae bacterium]|nr:YdcF family protein [Bradyrhizobiaceae bacterium]
MGSDDRQSEVSRSASRRGGRRCARQLAAAAAVLAALFAVGFLLFADSLPNSEKPPARKAEGIVVLTGGASRIVDAVQLLASGHGQRLLISGVHPSTTPGEILRGNPEFERLLACCIDLGREATNTVGNAVEAGRWARERKFRSLIVVTSGWHMPRALVEIERELPDVDLVPYPVISERMRAEPWWSDPQTIRLLLIEYVKYMASLLHIRIDPAQVAALAGAAHVSAR